MFNFYIPKQSSNHNSTITLTLSNHHYGLFQVSSRIKTQKHNFLLSFLGLLISTLISHENMQTHGETQKCTNFRTFSSITSFFPFVPKLHVMPYVLPKHKLLSPLWEILWIWLYKFENINLFFHPKCNWDLSKHYWHAFGTPHIINNEFHV